MSPEPAPAPAPEPLDRALRERLFAWLDPSSILHEDEALIAIDKSPGVPAQEARAGAEDDLPSRLGRARGHVGVHQRLDKDTSGVIVYAASPAASAGLAAALEGRRAEKTYVAGVERWTRGAVTLRDRLAYARGRSEVVPARDPRGKDAITHVRGIARGAGGRALLEVRIETGRTHQIRAQLAHAGAPIAGDALYGGAAAPRLMLHSARIALDHPTRGERIVIEAPRPLELDAWLQGRELGVRRDRPLLARMLAIAVQRRFALGRAALRDPAMRTSAFRLVNDAGDGVPGVAIDVYADWALLHLYGEDAERDEDALADAIAALGFAGVYVKRRPRQANVIADGETSVLAPAAPIRGRAAPDEFVVREEGLPLLVRLGDGLGTGLFLDQRAHRARVRATSAGLRVLNLFAYTCGFSVAAAAGGARETVSVDASGAALDRGRANLALAGADPAAHRTVRADVFEWLERAARRGERFDLVCCDPPTYSSVKRGTRWSSGRQWRALAAACLAVLAPGGALLATSNDRRMTQRALRAELRAGATEAGVALESLRDLPPPEDFPAPAGSEPHLKAALARRT